MSDSTVDVKKPAAAKKKATPRTNPLENLQLTSSKRGTIKAPERYALESEVPSSRAKKSSTVKKVPSKVIKKSTKKASVPKKSNTKKQAPKKMSAPKKSNVVNNISPVIAVAAN